MHVYEVPPAQDKRGVDLISDALPFGRLWYTKASNAFDYAQFYSRSHDAVIRVYDEAGNVIETRERTRRFLRVSKTNLFMLDPARLVRLRLGPWAASGEDSS